MESLIRSIAAASPNETAFWSAITSNSTIQTAKDSSKIFSLARKIWNEKENFGKNRDKDKGDGKGVVSSLTSGIQSILSAQQAQYIPGPSEEMINVDNIASGIGQVFKIFEKGVKSPIDLVKNLILFGSESITDQVVLYLKQQSGLLNMINKQAGLTGDYAEAFRDALTEANPRLVQLGIDFQDLAYAAKATVDQSGKFATINQETWERAGEVAGAYVGTLQELVVFYPEFEKIGIGAATSQERIAKAGKDALEVGIQSKKALAEIRTNLGRINEYGFKNGVDGLSAMVRKSIEFRSSMESVFTIAEKVFSPEGAIELSANLQVLGGAIGDFNDPLKLMYMATNNVEGLQDALIGAAGSLATYNEKQGRFEVTGANLRKASEMAKALGISMKELTTTAIASSERTAATTALLARGITLDDKQREFLTNIAQMKDGRMVIQLGASKELTEKFGKSEVAIEELTSSQVETIMGYQKQLEKLSEEEIIRKQATDVENIMRDVNSMAARGRIVGGRAGGGIVQSTVKRLTGSEVGDITNTTSQMAKNFNKNFKDYEEDIVRSYSKYLNDFIDITKKGLNEAADVFEPILDRINYKEPTAGSPTSLVTPTPVSPDFSMDYQNKMINTNQLTADNTGLIASKMNTTNQAPTIAKLDAEDMKSLKQQNQDNLKPTLINFKNENEKSNDYAIFASNTEKSINQLNNNISLLSSGIKTYDFGKLNNEKPLYENTFKPIDINIKGNEDNSQYVAMVGSIKETSNKLMSLYEEKNRTKETTKESPERPMEIVKTLKIEITTPDTIFDGLKTKLMMDNVFIGDLKEKILNEKEFMATSYMGLKA